MDKNKEIILQIVQGLEDSEEISYVRALLETFKIMNWADRDLILGVAQNLLGTERYEGRSCYQVDLYGDDETLGLE